MLFGKLRELLIRRESIMHLGVAFNFRIVDGKTLASQGGAGVISNIPLSVKFHSFRIKLIFK
jgi:hypothetical protein